VAEVYETDATIAELQELLDRSIAAAGPHLQAIFGPETAVPAAELVELLPGMQVIDLATVTASGLPRVAPVDGLFFEGRWIFGSSPQSARARHLARRPGVSAAHTRGEGLCVITHGHAVPVDLRKAGSAAVLAHWRDIYPTFDEWASPDTPCWRLEPTHLFARRPAPEPAA
jgi:hypothetical protein